MAMFPVNFPSISLMLALLVAAVFATDPRRSDAAELSREQLCNFNEETRTYNATDLLLCMNELAANILLQGNGNPNRITDRAYQDTRQSYLAYPFAPDYSTAPANAGASSNYYGNQMLQSLLSAGGLHVPNLSNLFDFSSFSMPGFKLFSALSTISKYDDAKCVPRILCEVASGSTPGNLAYRQSSNFQDFGQNALFGLLTAFDTNGASPILNFGKAALLGVTNRGRPNMCYQEYSRCPRDQDQLISYLNNHNGGFFRLFNNPGNYYRPQQSYYKPFYKNSVAQYRIANPKTEIDSPYHISLNPESDRTGTGQLSFINSDSYEQGDSNKNFFSNKLRDRPGQLSFINSDSYEQGDSNNNFFSNKLRDRPGQLSFINSDNYESDDSNKNFFSNKLRERPANKVVFPKEKRENRFESNQLTKYFKVSSDLSVSDSQKESVRKDRQFFPQEDENQKYNSGYFNQLENNRRPRTELFKNLKTQVHFPRDYNPNSLFFKTTSTFAFPKDYDRY